ncbi:PAS domain-containing protein, partial [Methylobacterium platani]
MIDDLERLSRAELEAEVRQLRAERDAGSTASYVANLSPPGRSTPADAGVLFSAVERTGLPMIITDPNLPDEPIIFANRAFQEMCGYGADELLGRNCRFLQGLGSEQDQLTALRAALAQGRNIALEITNYRKDGTAFINNLFVAPVYDADGRLLYRFGSQLDVTEVHRNRQRLAENEERQRAIFNSASEMAIIVTDTEGRVTDWNVGAERILGWS